MQAIRLIHTCQNNQHTQIRFASFIIFEWDRLSRLSIEAQWNGIRMTNMLFDTSRFGLSIHDTDDVTYSSCDDIATIDQFFKATTLVFDHCLKIMKYYCQPLSQQHHHMANNHNNSLVAREILHCGSRILSICSSVIKDAMDENSTPTDTVMCRYKQWYFETLKHIMEYMKVLKYDNCQNANFKRKLNSLLEERISTFGSNFHEISSKLLYSMHICEQIN